MMQFRIDGRDGPSRIGKIKLNNKKITSPNIFFIHTNRYRSPSYADIILTNIENKTNKLSLKFTKNIILDHKLIKDDKAFFELKDKDIYTLKYASQTFKKPKRFVKTIIKNKEEIGYQKIMYTPSIAEPKNLSLLVYLGIDFFDSVKAIIYARNKTMFSLDGNLKIKDLEENPCMCPTCININKEIKDMTFEDILNHNYNILYSELKNVRNHIRNKNIRDLVEKRVKTDPHLTTILRYLDQNNYNYLEKQTSVTGRNTIFATTTESMNRPEIKRFQNRVINVYKKPKLAKILVLLPCSAKKPYSFSKSHGLFRKSIFSPKNPNVIHEIIITSPLGIVPREMELTYPASNYDIPVTGTWFEDEKNMINNLLERYLKKNSYDIVISHLPEEMNNFVKNVVNIDTFTCINHPSSDESLNRLKEILEEKTSKYKKVDNKNRLKENIEAILSYQFGNKTATKLVENTDIKGRYPYLKIMKKNIQLGMLVKEKGLVSLTLDGAKILFEDKQNLVEIYDDFKLKGSVFAPGVKNADENIRIGDEAVVFRKNKLIGVGSALMNGSQMKQLTYGEAVKIRHLKKD